MSSLMKGNNLTWYFLTVLGIIWYRNDTLPVFVFLTADDMETEVYPVYDSLDIISQYRARVRTPICKVSECYDVVIDFYWDLYGRYSHFDTVIGFPLTKKEHEPFETEDYQKLQKVLSNPNPHLKNYTKDELVVETETEQVDGWTGATLLAVKDEIVSGAAFSCYTLWHIAHGVVRDSIIKSTSKRLVDDKLLYKLAASEQETAHYFLVDHLDHIDRSKHRHLLQQFLLQHGPYFTRYVIEKLPSHLFADTQMQQFFAQKYNEMGYFGQVSLLNRLQGRPIVNELSSTLINSMDTRNSKKNVLVISHCLNQITDLEPKTVECLFNQILTHELAVDHQSIKDMQEKDLEKDLLLMVDQFLDAYDQK